MRVTILGLLIFISSSVSYADPLRVIVPEQSDLAGYEIQEGELARGGPGLRIALSTGDGNDWVNLSDEESIASTYKISSTEIVVLPGSLRFGLKVIEITTPLTCSYSVSGLGGYDPAAAPSGSQIQYFYLIYDKVTNPGVPRVSCMISTSSLGPQDWSITGMPWKRLYSFWSGANFTSMGEKVFYTSGADMTFNTTSPSACTSLSLPRIAGDTQRAKLRLTCNTAGSTSYSIYTESTCSVAAAITATCSTAASLPSFIEMSPNQPLYYKGVVGSVQTLNILEINEMRKMSTP